MDDAIGVEGKGMRGDFPEVTSYLMKGKKVSWFPSRRCILGECDGEEGPTAKSYLGQGDTSRHLGTRPDLGIKSGHVLQN